MDRCSELFDYEGFLQEVEHAKEKYGYSICLLANMAGLDESTLRNVLYKRTLGFPSATALSAILNVSIDKYVKAA